MNRISLFFVLVCFVSQLSAANIAGLLGGTPPVAVAPAFGAEIQRTIETDGGATKTLTVASAIAQNKRIVVVTAWHSATQTVPVTNPVTDDGGNIYQLDKQLNNVNGLNWAIFSANASTALTTSSRVYVNWQNPGYSYRAYAIFTLTGTNTSNASAVDQTASNFGGSGTTVSATASTTATNTLLFGVAATYNSSVYTPAWTLSGAKHTWDNSNGQINYLYKTETSSGSKNIGGTINVSSEWSALWVAYKS